MKKYGGAKTQKKNNKKKHLGVKKYTFKNTKAKERKLQNNLKKLMENPENDHYSYQKVLAKFEKFFNGILKLEDKIVNLNDMKLLNDFDMKKFEISDKLQVLDDENGKLMSRIRKLSPDIYNKIKDEIEVNNNNNKMNTNNNNKKNVSSDIIELYAKVLEALNDLNDKTYYNYNAELDNNLSIVSSILSNELITEFLEVKKNTKSVEDELVDMFKGFNIKKNSSSMENDISKILSNLKL
jgi:hypothetical protein